MVGCVGTEGQIGRASRLGFWNNERRNSASALEGPGLLGVHLEEREVQPRYLLGSLTDVGEHHLRGSHLNCLQPSLLLGSRREGEQRLAALIPQAVVGMAAGRSPLTARLGTNREAHEG